MTSRKIYRYLGRNGILTTHILIEGANYIPLVELTADKGKVLTNGEKTVYAVIPAIAKPFVSEVLVETIIQSVFDKVEEYARKQLNK